MGEEVSEEEAPVEEVVGGDLEEEVVGEEVSEEEALVEEGAGGVVAVAGEDFKILSCGGWYVGSRSQGRQFILNTMARFAQVPYIHILLQAICMVHLENVILSLKFGSFVPNKT